MGNQVVCILGMHRSGTSCLTGSLQSAGLFLGNVSNKDPFNIKGNRENGELRLLQDAVLADNGGGWDSPPEMVVWNSQHYAELCGIVEKYNAHRAWGFKDPRTLFTLSGFERCIDNLQYIGTFRNPFCVAKSLLKRDVNIGSEEYCLELWNKYNTRLIEVWEKHRFPIINFDKDDLRYAEDLKKIYKYLGLRQSYLSIIIDRIGIKWMRKAQHTRQNDGFFDPALRSSSHTNIDGLPDHILETYVRLKEISL